MIMADNGNFECKGAQEQLLLDFAFIYDEMLKAAPEIILSVQMSRTKKIQKAFTTADHAIIAELYTLAEKTL